MRSGNWRTFASINAFILAGLVLGVSTGSAGEVGSIKLWTNGLVYYRFDDGTLGPVPITADDRRKIGTEMKRWEDALTIIDPATGLPHHLIEFRPCGNHCEGSYLVIRYNKINDAGQEEHECNNMSVPVGMEVRGANGHPDGITELNLRRGVCVTQQNPAAGGVAIDPAAGTNQEPRIILHELGHALGLWHEFNREDADHWLHEDPDFDGPAVAEAFGMKADRLPVLGNYDYDSIMGYGSSAPLPSPDNPMVTLSLDVLDNTVDKDVQGTQVSKRDRSRLLQYYAREQYPNWGFFTSLSAQPEDPDLQPNPYLAQGVEVVGTPAIAHQDAEHYDVFARGSDDRLYWRSHRRILVKEADPSRPPYKPIFKVGWTAWEAIGSRFRSDPSAVSRRLGRMDVVAVNEDGDVQLIRYIDGNWSEPLTLRGGHPAGGIRQPTPGHYTGPAIASRGANLLDVFVVRDDGRLAVTTWADGNWEQWVTLGAGYSVTARPAAVALSATEVRLAINESDTRLYEPGATLGGAGWTFELGAQRATMAYQAPPSVAKRSGRVSLYRVLIVNADGRISHRLAAGDWMDIGGLPKPGSGISVVATGAFAFKAIMNGEDATGCDLSCSNKVDPATHNAKAPHPNGAYIQPGGLWIRDFK